MTSTTSPLICLAIWKNWLALMYSIGNITRGTHVPSTWSTRCTFHRLGRVLSSSRPAPLACQSRPRECTTCKGRISRSLRAEHPSQLAPALVCKWKSKRIWGWVKYVCFLHTKYRWFHINSGHFYTGMTYQCWPMNCGNSRCIYMVSHLDIPQSIRQIPWR